MNSLRSYPRDYRLIGLSIAATLFLAFNPAFGQDYGRNDYSLNFKGSLLTPLDARVIKIYKFLYGGGLESKYYFSKVPMAFSAEVIFLHGGDMGNLNSSQGDYMVNVLPMTIGTSYEFMPKKAFNMFAAGGIGIVYISYLVQKPVSDSASNPVDEENQTALGMESYSNGVTNFGFWIGGGFDYKFNRNWGIKSDIRYMFFGTPEIVGGNLGGIFLHFGGTYNF